MRQTINSLPSVASGIAVYGVLCDLTKAPYLPPTASRRRRLGDCVDSGVAFPTYEAFMAKARQILELPTDWEDEGVEAGIRGLMRAKEYSPFW